MSEFVQVAPFLIIPSLIALNALFVAAEFALVTSSGVTLAHRAQEGDKISTLLYGIVSDPTLLDRYVATAQVGITCASLGLGMYGENVLAEFFLHIIHSQEHTFAFGDAIAAHTVASVLALTLLTYFHVVLGEMIPKSVSLANPERVAAAVIFPIQWFQTIVFPVISSLNSVATAILRVAGVRRKVQSLSFSPAELRLIFQESQEQGLVSSDAGQMIEELFDLRELSAYDIMVPRVKLHGMRLGGSGQEIRNLITQSLHTRYAVWDVDRDHIVGTLHIRELLKLLESGESVRLDQLHTVAFIPETALLDVILAAMHKSKNQLVVVIDEYGGTSGIITIDDIFDELVGDFPEIHSSPYHSGAMCVSGEIRVTELLDLLDLEDLDVPEDVTTVGGLVLSDLNRPARPGDITTLGPIRIKVTQVNGFAIEECEIEVIASDLSQS